MSELRTWIPFAYRAYRLATWIVWCFAWVWLRWMRSRSQEWRERLAVDLRGDPGGVSSSPEQGPVWVHAASVGEVAAALPFVRVLAARGTAVCMTVVTPAGVRIARAAFPDGGCVRFAPLDLVPVVRRALRASRPSLLILIETELWPNLLVEADAAGVPVAMVNARLSERSLANYRSKASPLRGVASLVSVAVCQSEDDVRRFVRLGFDRSRLRSFGSTKFDALAKPLSASERERLRESLGFAPDERIVVFGSVRPREEPDVVRAVSVVLAEIGRARVIVAPRHLERVGRLEAALESAGVSTVRRTALRDGRLTVPGLSGDRRTSASKDVPGAVVLDTTGELGSAYAIGEVAFVGGTLSDYGGHNPLEPAAQGVPVLFGPYTGTCRESAELLTRAGAAIVVEDGAALNAELLRILRDEEVRRSMETAALGVMEEGRGASVRAADWLAEVGLLSRGSSGRGIDS